MNSKLTLEQVGLVSPALEKFTRSSVAGLWNRFDLSPRDRSIVNVAALVARNQTGGMPGYCAIHR